MYGELWRDWQGLQTDREYALELPVGTARDSFLEQLHMLSERYTRLHLLQVGRDSRACAEHERMLAFWLAGETDLSKPNRFELI